MIEMIQILQWLYYLLSKKRNRNRKKVQLSKIPFLYMTSKVLDFVSCYPRSTKGFVTIHMPTLWLLYSKERVNDLQTCALKQRKINWKYVCVCVCVYLCVCLVTQSCPAFCGPMDCSLPDCSVHGIFQAKILE